MVKYEKVFIFPFSDNDCQLIRKALMASIKPDSQDRVLGLVARINRGDSANLKFEIPDEQDAIFNLEHELELEKQEHEKTQERLTEGERPR